MQVYKTLVFPPEHSIWFGLSIREENSSGEDAEKGYMENGHPVLWEQLNNAGTRTKRYKLAANVMNSLP